MLIIDVISEFQGITGAVFHSSKYIDVVSKYSIGLPGVSLLAVFISFYEGAAFFKANILPRLAAKCLLTCFYDFWLFDNIRLDINTQLYLFHSNFKMAASVAY